VIEPAKPPRRPITIVGWLCGVLLAAFVLLFVGAWIYGAFHSSVLGALRDVNHLAVFIANACVVVFAFRAFLRTRDRVFLCLAAAALCFGYSPLYSMLFSLGSRGPTAWHMSRSQAYWYHVAQYVADLAGLFLYAYGIVSLARRAKREA
jgi:hypothetical protein